MFRFRLFFPFFFLSYLSFAQTVENIRVEPEGEKINIYYRIGGSTEAQLYDVKLACSIDGGPRFEPEALIGDVHGNIRGGKSYYLIVWDVFEDVDEIGNVEFFIKVELMEDAASKVSPYGEQVRQTDLEPPESQEEEISHAVREKEPGQAAQEEKPTEGFRVEETKSPDPYNNRFLLSYRASHFNLFGFTAGTLGKWGVYGSARIGVYDALLERLPGSLTGGITKSLFTTGKHRLHGYAGAGIGDYFNELDLEAGISGLLWNRLVLTLGLEYPGYYTDLVFGIGIVL